MDNHDDDTQYQSPKMTKGTVRVLNAFSQALLEKDYQQSLWKGQGGSFASVLTLMKATEIQMDLNKVSHL